MNVFEIEDLSLMYSDGNESLRRVTMQVPEHAITVLFGPAGGGKSTLLRVLNRLNDMADVKSVSGRVLFHGQDVLSPGVDVVELRRKVGIVFSRPAPLPLSIYENVCYGLRIMGERRKSFLDEEIGRAHV